MDDIWLAEGSGAGAEAVNTGGINRLDCIGGDGSVATGSSVILCFGDRGP